MMKARIAEVFDSIQGEGLYLGERQVFVRFYGCNLTCRFCDTRLDSYMEYEPEELFQELRLYNNDFHSVSYTGGEPLMHKDFLKEILKLTSACGWRNYLETNGTLFNELEEVIGSVDIVAMDLKLPSSTGMVNVWEMHRRFLKIASAKEVFLKAVICESTSDEDMLEAVRLIRQINQAAVLILQPNSFERYHNRLIEKMENYKELARREKVTAFVIPQIHKGLGIK